MFFNQHIQHDAVDLVIAAPIRDDLHVLAMLSKPIDSAFSLFVTRRVPTQVVVNHGIKNMLQVDAFAEAIRADEDAALDIS